MTDEKRPGKYPVELRDRTVRMVFEAEQHCDSQWEAVVSVVEKLGPTAETVRKWVRRVEIDEGRKSVLSSDERERLKGLERENRELRRANEILKAARPAAPPSPPRAPLGRLIWSIAASLLLFLTGCGWPT